MSQENEVWSWNSDTQGRIHSVSSGFTAIFGASASKDIIGHCFWTFAEGIDKPIAGWSELDNAFKQQTKINKFVFHYYYQKNKIKIAISGDPIFEKNKYIGFSGTGYIANNSELSIPEISQNIITMSLDGLDVGIAMFSSKLELIEYNQQFVAHMASAKVKIDRNITYDTIVSNLQARNQYQQQLSSDINHNSLINSHYYFEKADKTLVCIKKKILDNGLIILKTELDKNLLHSLKNQKDVLSELKQQNKMLEVRIQDYKDKLSDFFNKKNKTETKDINLKKTLSFYENNIDIGILVTNINGEIETVNYYMAQIFGFTTVSMLMFHYNDGDFKDYLAKRQERIVDLQDNSLSRFEHIMSINNFISQGDFKEVIVFYPSIHNPEKVISLFYPLEATEHKHTHDAIKNDNNPLHLDMYQQFIHYIIDDIKTSINVISGYNDLQLMNTNTTQGMPYTHHISESCSHILHSISDVMQVYKISSNLSSLEQSVFSCEDILNECLEHVNPYMLNNNITMTLDVEDNYFLIISDRNIFADALTKILNTVVRSSQKSSRLKIKIIENLSLVKISLVIIDESQLNIENLVKTDISEIFNNQAIRNTGSLNFKIAENYLTLLKCRITAINQNERGNILTIEMSEDMLTSHQSRDKDNLVI